jgi:beta-glucosidase
MQGAISAAQPNRAPTRFNNTKMGCAFQPQASLPFCDATLPHTARAADLMRRLPVATKLAMLRSKNPAVPSLGLGSYDWDTEVLHGVFSGHENFPTSLLPRPSHLFPNGVGLAATFDTELVEEVGGLIGAEQRALNNLVRWTHPGIESGQYQGVNGYAPNCNLYRDPRWGRAQETYGESPVHNEGSCIRRTF